MGVETSGDALSYLFASKLLEDNVHYQVLHMMTCFRIHLEKTPDALIVQPKRKKTR